MPRLARIDIPGLLQHVIVRGIERRNIFNDDHDCQLFVDRLFSLCLETGVHCYAWTLLSNHAHLLLMPTSTSLSIFMRRLLTGYAVSFNRRNKRSGHLFQNRNKSIVCEEETYLLELVRYIHLNPLRAGMVSNLEELDHYPWSGHVVLMGNRQVDGHDTDAILEQLEVKLRDKKSPITLARLLNIVSTALKLDPDSIRKPSKSRAPAAARGIICHLAIIELGYTGSKPPREGSVGSGLQCCKYRVICPYATQTTNPYT